MNDRPNTQPSGPFTQAATERSPRRKSWAGNGIFLGAIAVVAGALWWNGATQKERASEAMAGVFGQRVSFVEASRESRASGRPLFVFATADWCGPCQSFKATTLADEGVAAALTEQTVPYYLDVTSIENMDDDDKQLATTLNVTSIPAMYIVQDGEVVSALRGGTGSDQFMAWLEEATP